MVSNATVSVITVNEDGVSAQPTIALTVTYAAEDCKGAIRKSAATSAEVSAVRVLPPI